MIGAAFCSGIGAPEVAAPWIDWHGKPAADGPKYKALGNSMAVPVVRWIMNRIRISSARQKRTPHPGRTEE